MINHSTENQSKSPVSPKILVCAAFVLAFAVSFSISNARADGAPGAVADVSLTPAGDFKAKMDDIKGEAIKKGDTFTADKIVINLKTLKTGLPLRDKHGKEKYLEVDKFPEAVFSNAVGKDGKGTGKLKLHGIEKDVAGTYKTDDKFLYAEFPIKLSDFGISGIKYMGVGVDDAVNVHVTIALKK